MENEKQEKKQEETEDSEEVSRQYVVLDKKGFDIVDTPDGRPVHAVVWRGSTKPKDWQKDLLNLRKKAGLTETIRKQIEWENSIEGRKAQLQRLIKQSERRARRWRI